ncbi:MAG: hypothetical protein ACRD0J_02235 [Acidimicrobiales bacterium]
MQTRSPARKGRSPRRLAGIAAVVAAVVAAAVAFAVLTGRSAGAPTPTSAYGKVQLPVKSAAAGFAPLNTAGLAPADVLGAIPIPSDARVSRRTTNDHFRGTFDRSVTYTSGLDQTVVHHFFLAALAHRQWRVLDTTNPILARHASSDGYYWEVGVTLSPAPAGSAGGGGTSGSSFTVRLIQTQGGE